MSLGADELDMVIDSVSQRASRLKPFWSRRAKPEKVTCLAPQSTSVGVGHLLPFNRCY